MQILLLPPAAQGKKKNVNRGYLHERTLRESGDLEKAFADLWEEMNGEDRGHINSGQGVLQDLFMSNRNGFHYVQHMVSDSERYVAATVVQWLGTNCGFSFLIEALRKCGYRIVEGDEEVTELPPPKCQADTFVLKRPKLL
jgi:hypothetical protein